MCTRLVLCIFLLTLVLSPVKAQTTGPVRDPNAIALAGKALQALTGGKALQDITLEASASYVAGSDQQSGTATLVALGNQQSRVTLNLTGGQRLEIRNGPSGAWSGPDGATHSMATHNCFLDAAWFFPALTLEALQTDSTLGVAYLGPGQWNGAAALHLQFFHILPAPSAAMTAEIQKLSAVDLYLDPKSLAPLALGYNTHPDDNLNLDIPVQIRFADYRNLGGVLAPFRIQKFLQGRLTLDLALTQAAINSGVPSSTFATPELPTGGAQ